MFEWIIAHWSQIVAIIVGLLGVIIMIAELIPGEQPEKTLKKIVEFIEKFSRK